MSNSKAAGDLSQMTAWNHHPELPLARAPIFDWPAKPLEVLKWQARTWLTFSPATFFALLAVAVWFSQQKPIETYETFEFGWLLENHLRNLVLMTLVAGGLHLYFYTFKKQGEALRFDPRILARQNNRFTFNNQVLDNMFWTLASGVTFWTAYEAVMLWAYANNSMPLLDWQDNPVWFVILFPVLASWHELHFYFAHRLLHWPPLYRVAHAVHHRNTDPGPWSGISMHPYEHAVYFTSLLIHVVLPTHPIHLLFHLYWVAVAPSISHSGYAGILVGGKNRFATGSFFHQLHHRCFECNYATATMPVDCLVDSFHDGTRESDTHIQQRRKRRRKQS